MLTTNATEADVGAACDALAAACGWDVQRYEQRRATRITEGLPDRRLVRPGQRVWVELKAPGGKLTTAQHAWLLSELEAGALATVIESPDQLARLLALLARRSAPLEASARDLCRSWVDLCWRRGPRDGKGPQSRRNATRSTECRPGVPEAAERERIAPVSRHTVEGRP